MELNALQQAIKDKIVSPALKERQHMLRARVLQYHYKMNRATIEFNNPFGPGRRRLNGVPVVLSGGGMHSAGPFPGDEVWVNFVHGNLLYGRIVAIADEDYEFNSREKRLKHKREGAFTPDQITMR